MQEAHTSGVVIVYREEATSLGAAICGRVGIGLYQGIEVAGDLVKVQEVFTPKKEVQRVYDEIYPVFVRSYLALQEVFPLLP